MTIDGKPPTHELVVDTKTIYLTDSAHRHFGIAEAVMKSASGGGEYPNFDPDFEFLVEVHNLSADHERELFIELNSKQKKITTTKIKELDKSSPIGVLKDAVLRMDAAERGLFTNNIEVTSNTNNKHTLMTMSVFVSTLSEMFDKKEISYATKQGTIEDLARYYCDYSYMLSDQLRVNAAVGGDGAADQEYAPIRNLYTEIIEPKENEPEDDAAAFPSKQFTKLDAAREHATELNAAFRKVDISNNNATLKALYRIGGDIRQMPDWSKPVKYLQSGLIDATGGKFFQQANQELFETPPSDIPIASINDDKSINVQVQTKVISRLYAYLRRKLELERSTSIVIIQASAQKPVYPGDPLVVGARPGETHTLSFFAQVPGIKGAFPEEEDLRVAIRAPKGRPDLKKCGLDRTATKAVVPVSPPKMDLAYSHPKYDDFVQWRVPFEFDFVGPATDAILVLEVTIRDDRGASSKQKFSLTISVETTE